MKYQELLEAKELLNLSDYASLEEIKQNYRSLMNKWHPDKGNSSPEKCEEMSKRITLAYKLVMTYVSNYKYSFLQTEFKRHLSGEDWWFEKFGNNPMW